ncbi:MAG: hypothetical protein HUK13_00050 [Muribaculaceae bacterium]|nr:hypothetical protein [Muribaculaceae bacterium]
MNQDTQKKLAKDPDGLETYQYIANHIDDCDDDMPFLVENMVNVDTTGQFTVSAARYLATIDRNRFARYIDHLIAAAIDKDREHRYIAELLPTIWGADWEAHAPQLVLVDDNFRRIYKRVNGPADRI